MAWLAWAAKPSSLLVARAVFLGAERRLGGIATTTGKRLSFYDQLVWISANLYIQVVVVLWPRLKFSFPQTFEYPDIADGRGLPFFDF